MKEQQEARARRARLVMMVRRTPLYQCQRDHVVFVPGTGKAMSISEIAGMLKRGQTPEAIARALGGLPEQ